MLTDSSFVFFLVVTLSTSSLCVVIRARVCHDILDVNGLLIVSILVLLSWIIIRMLTWLMTVTSVTMSGLFVRLQWSMLVFVTQFGLFHVHLLPVFFWNMVLIILYFLDGAHSTKVSPLSVFISSPNLPFAVSKGMVLFCSHVSHSRHVEICSS